MSEDTVKTEEPKPTVSMPRINRKTLRKFIAISRKKTVTRMVDRAKRNARNKIARASRKRNRK